MWTLWTGDSTTHRIEDPAGEDDGIAPWADEGGFKSGRLRYGGFKKAAEVCMALSYFQNEHCQQIACT